MEDKLIYELLKAHEPMSKLLLEHGYVPHGGHVFVNDMARVHEATYKSKVCTTCSSDVTNATKQLYTMLYPKLKEQFELTTVNNGRSTKKVRKS
jgi:hypothetical protein